MSRDILWAFRWLRHNPLFTAAVIGILALGIGANTAIFSIVDAVLLRPLPYAAASRLARIEETGTRNNGGRILSDDFLALSRELDLFEKIAAHTRDDVTFYGAGGARSGSQPARHERPVPDTWYAGSTGTSPR